MKRLLSVLLTLALLAGLVTSTPVKSANAAANSWDSLSVYYSGYGSEGSIINGDTIIDYIDTEYQSLSEIDEWYSDGGIAPHLFISSSDDYFYSYRNSDYYFYNHETGTYGNVGDDFSYGITKGSDPHSYTYTLIGTKGSSYIKEGDIFTYTVIFAEEPSYSLEIVSNKITNVKLDKKEGLSKATLTTKIKVKNTGDTTLFIDDTKVKVKPGKTTTITTEISGVDLTRYGISLTKKNLKKAKKDDGIKISSKTLKKWKKKGLTDDIWVAFPVSAKDSKEITYIVYNKDISKY